MFGTLDADDIADVLRGGTIGRLGLISGGVPYVVPITYAYDAHCIVGHSAAGHKLTALRSSDVVCFEVEEITDLGNWRSVIAWGRYEELEGDELQRAIDLLIDAVTPRLAVSATEREAQPVPTLGDPHPYALRDHPHHSAAGAVLYRIHIHEATGRFEMQEDER